MSPSPLVWRLATLEESIMSGPWSVGQIEGQMERSGGLVLCVDAAGNVSIGTEPSTNLAEVVGFAVLQLPSGIRGDLPDEPPATEPATEPAELLRIGVLAPHLRRGLAGRLLRRGDELASRCTERLILEVSAGNGPALACYQSHGFREFSRRRNYYRDGSDALLLEKRLRAYQRPPPSGSIL